MFENLYAQREKFKGKPLYETIVARAREQGLQGATVTRDITGFGRKRKVRTTKILVLSESLPLTVEIVDTPDQIQAFIDNFLSSIPDVLMTLNDAWAVRYTKQD
ncbi:MAG: DUF190 domain-containing protein [Balneolaceae bacterium]|nr:DUF190 domain-containing protein [Balneolaceae bacterium]